MEYSILVRPDYFEEHEKAVAKEASKTKKTKLPSDIKLALYRQQNYRTRLLREKGREINIRQKQAKNPIHQPETKTNPIVATLPKSVQEKGEAFLTFLQSIPDFKINEKGEISYKDRPVRGSRIVDILHDFVRDRPTKSPAIGFELLARILKDHNVPREFIGNRSHWKYIQGLTATPSTPRRNLASTLSELQDLRRRLPFQSGSGVAQALKRLKWKLH